MSRKEVDRLWVVQQVAERRILQQEAAARLGLSVPQVKRLLQQFRGEGAAGLVSRHRGRRPNNALAPEFRQEILAVTSSIFCIASPHARLRVANPFPGPSSSARQLGGFSFTKANIA